MYVYVCINEYICNIQAAEVTVSSHKLRERVVRNYADHDEDYEAPGIYTYIYICIYIYLYACV
jgi:hypothetical protein